MLVRITVNKTNSETKSNALSVCVHYILKTNLENISSKLSTLEQKHGKAQNSRTCKPCTKPFAVLIFT